MKELKCPDCNCKEMEWKNGMFHCPSCGSNFIPDADEIPKQSEKQNVIAEAFYGVPEEYQAEVLARIEIDMRDVYDCFRRHLFHRNIVVTIKRERRSVSPVFSVFSLFHPMPVKAYSLFSAKCGICL